MAPIPIDRGWAWMCVLGAGICSFVVVGGIKSLGILLVEIVQRFGASSATASLMMALVSVGVSVIAPLSTALGERFSYRSVIIVGGLLCAFANFATAFACNATYVVAVYGTFTGAGFGCIAGTSLVVVGMYFNKRRSLANGLAVSGGSAGQLIIPMLLRYLLDNYSFTGGLIIFSGICLHIIPAALLMRPFSFYTGIKSKKPTKSCDIELEAVTASEDTQVGEGDVVRSEKQLFDCSNFNKYITNCSDESPQEGSFQFYSAINSNNLNNTYIDYIDDDISVTSQDDVANDDTRSTVVHKGQDVLLNQNGLLKSRSPSDSSAGAIYIQAIPNDDDTSDIEADNPIEDEWSDDQSDPSELKNYLSQYQNGIILSNMTKYCDKDKAALRNPNNPWRCGRSFLRIRQDSVVSRLSIRSLDVAPLQDLPSCVEDDLDGNGNRGQPCNCPRDFLTTCCCCFIDLTPRDKPLIQWNLFRNKLFVLYVIAICLGNTGYMIACLYLPAHAEDIGMERHHAAMLLSVMGIVDLIGRIGGGWFADLGYISRSNFLGLSLLLTGVATFICIPLFSAGGLLALSVVMGLFGGCSVSLQTVVLVDYLGAEMLSASFGLSIMCQGFVNIILPTLLGVARDNLGSYVTSYLICAALMVLSGVAFMLEPCVRRCQERSKGKPRKPHIPLPQPPHSDPHSHIEDA